MAELARVAHESGRMVWTPTLGGDVGWDVVIEAIERQGWVLTNWAVASPSASQHAMITGSVSAYPVFRRVADGAA
ncbi:hypothetical protein ASG12_11830 [Williamsia sp. Leaf354]|nr:hypothetical protein ASG12_11830 [Williamsia sp. Leaf354]